EACQQVCTETIAPTARRDSAAVHIVDSVRIFDGFLLVLSTNMQVGVPTLWITAQRAAQTVSQRNTL
ncbi:MAG TPA: hypothetical protein VFE28_01545, partial [Candidatus Krumholzibacteria bacterium]|nr:hypothetical protein [Candidatus Krumholzibacteria bacterium]